VPPFRLLAGAKNGSVLIDGNRIVSVGGPASLGIPADAERIDCSGATISPGFCNAHVHFFERKWSDARAIDVADLRTQLEDFTRFGVTWVFDLSSAWENTRMVRERIECGEVPGPRIRSTGEGMVAPDSLPPPMVMAVLGLAPVSLAEIADAQQAARTTRGLLDAGVDGVKVFLSSNSGHAIFDERALQAVVDETHGAGKPVFAHPNTGDDVLAALRAGVDVIAHTTPRSGPWCDDILNAARARRSALIPTLALWKHLLRHDRASVQSQTIAAAVEQLRAWRQAGGIVIFGTDYGAVGADPSDEYELMRRAGMTTDEIVASMTSEPADFFGENDRGRLAPGCDADLVVLDEPLGSVRMTLRSGHVIYEHTNRGSYTRSGEGEVP
jgi:imidazolonepropionase-like amidohydrolase